MVILDTNVLSELMRPQPDSKVVKWMEAQVSGDIYTTSVTKAETLYGLQLMPDGRRKKALMEAAHEMFEMDFAARVLPFDRKSAEDYADLLSRRRKLGHPMSAFDAQIAAIARRHHASMATRNIADFADCGLVLINPWEA